MTFSIKTLVMMTFSIKALILMAFSIKTLILMTFSIKTTITLSTMADCCYAECHFCLVSFMLCHLC